MPLPNEVKVPMGDGLQLGKVSPANEPALDMQAIRKDIAELHKFVQEQTTIIKRLIQSYARR